MDMSYSSIIEPVATHYWGEPNPKLSSPGELRFGSHGSKSVNIAEGIWHDHESKTGGGVVDLIKLHEPKADIRKRLEEFGIESKSSNPNSEQIWIYENEDGLPRYQVIRKNGPTGKDYRQRRYLEGGKLEWGMTGVTALPYRLPQLLKSDDVIFIVEGEKCADAVIRLGLLATTNHGGANKWPPTLTPYFKGRAVVIIPDNDQAGHRHSQLVASSLVGTAAMIKIVNLPDIREKGDVYDWIAAGGTKNQLTDLANAAPFYSGQQLTQPSIASSPETRTANRINLVHWSELPDVETQWLVINLIPAGGLAALYGKPGTFKSFVALYVAAMVGSGKSVFGNDVIQGDVIYVAGEGGSGLKARKDATTKAHDIRDTSVHFLRSQLDLRSDDADREALLTEIDRLDLKPALIIIDTLSRAFAGGNENASEDMGKFIAHLTVIQLRLNAAALIIHHTGKDEARGQRGHSSLHGAVDAELEVQKLSEPKDEDRRGQITITKQKDGEDGLTFQYRLEIVSLSLIDSKKTSLAVMPIDESDITQPRRKPLSGHKKTAYDALKRTIDEFGELRVLSKIPADCRTAQVEEWRKTFYMMIPSDGEKNKDTRQRTFKRNSEALINDRTVGHWGDYVWFSDS
jgi:hypothetical protein